MVINFCVKNVKNRPRDKNSPNLVTLIGTREKECLCKRMLSSTDQFGMAEMSPSISFSASG
jgi:hypothetical protein